MPNIFREIYPSTFHSAPRALMLLRMLGAQNCSLLEGGLTEWVASNAPTHGDLVSVPRADPLGPDDNGGGWWSAYDQPVLAVQQAHTPFHCRWADLSLSATPSELDECVALVRQSSKQAAPEDHGLAIFSLFARQKAGTGAMDVQDHAAAFAVPADASTAASDELPPTSSLSRVASSLDPARRAAVLDYEAAKNARRQSINARRAILGLPPVASIHTSARGLHSAEQQPNGTSEPVHSSTARSKFVTNLFSRRSTAAASREVESVAPSILEEEAARRITVADASHSAAASAQANLVSRVVNAAVARSVFNVQLPVRRLSPISNNLMDLSPPPRLLPADLLAGHLRRISLIGNDLVTAADSGFVPINATPDQAAGGVASRPRSHAALDHPTILVACRSGLVSPLVVWALRSAGVPARWCIDAPL
jgi:hypothetical protein